MSEASWNHQRYQKWSSPARGRGGRGTPFNAGRGRGGAGGQNYNTNTHFRGSEENSSFRTPEEKSSDRKQQRRAQREAERHQRIQAQAQWSQQCRAQRAAAAEARKQEKKRAAARQSSATTRAGTRKRTEGEGKPQQNRKRLRETTAATAMEEEGAASWNKHRERQAPPQRSASSSPPHGMNHEEPPPPTKKTKRAKTEIQTKAKHLSGPITSTSQKKQGAVAKEKEELFGKKNKKSGTEPKKKATQQPGSEETSPLNGGDGSQKSALSALLRFRRAERSDAPPGLVRLLHNCVNKLTVENMTDMIQEVAHVFQGGAIPSADPVSSSKRKAGSRDHSVSAVVASRGTVMACLMDELDRWGSMETEGALSTLTTGLPFAGLLRGLQLLGGDVVGADLVERLCRHLYRHIQRGEEEGGGSATMLLSLLYLLCGVDVSLMISLLRTLLDEAEMCLSEEGGGDKGIESTAENEEEGPVQEENRSTSSATPLPPQVLCAASCALTLLRACGEKMLKETPTEMEAVVQRARRVADRLQGRIGATRFAALVQVMQSVVRGQTRSAKRNLSESDAPVERTLEGLKTLLPQYASKTSSKRVLGRVIQTAHVLTGVRFEEVLMENKPPQWWTPGVMASFRKEQLLEEVDRSHDTAKKTKKVYSKVFDEEISVSDEASSEGARENDSSSEEEDNDEAAQEELHQAKRAAIQRLRAEEKALSGQRFTTEHAKEVFHCLTSSADDLEAFTLLMHRDPGYHHFQDVCRVAIQCCIQEKQYNAFYARVMERFCHARRQCRTVLQFALWDYFKTVRILSRPDVCGFLNLACCIADWMEHEVVTLSILRGLDLEETNKCIGLLARMILLRVLLRLSPKRFTTVFFGGDGRVALDFRTDTSDLRKALDTLLQLYFDAEASDGATAGGDAGPAANTTWLFAMFDVVANGTPFDIYQASEDGGAAPSQGDRRRKAGDAGSLEKVLRNFQKRVQVARKALRQGLW